MKITTLIDNNAPEELACEWGLSVLIEGESATVLLDAGDSGVFAQNAEKLGIDLNAVDYAALSHAHFDHANGFDAFFALNDHAPLLIQEGCAENCYSDALEDMAYVGTRRGMLAEYSDRIRRVKGTVEFAPGFWLIGHDEDHLGQTAFDPHMLLYSGGASGGTDYPGADAAETAAEAEDFIPAPDQLTRDYFAHEQTLVAETPSGLIVFNSCSHSGIELIITEVREQFPDKPIRAFVGGLHLFTRSDEEVQKVADMIDSLGIQRVCTGHCTGDAAMEILRERLGDKLVTFESGAVLFDE